MKLNTVLQAFCLTILIGVLVVSAYGLLSGDNTEETP